MLSWNWSSRIGFVKIMQVNLTCGVIQFGCIPGCCFWKSRGSVNRSHKGDKLMMKEWIFNGELGGTYWKLNMWEGLSCIDLASRPPEHWTQGNRLFFCWKCCYMSFLSAMFETM